MPLRTTERNSFRLLVIGLLVGQPMTPAVILVEDACTLGDAITAANGDAPEGGCPAGSGADEIQLTDNVTLLAPVPALEGGVTVAGNGFGIRRDDAASDFSILHLTGMEPIALQNLAISNGRAAFGGGVLNEASGTVRITGSNIARNVALIDGGGVFNSADADLILENTIVTKNRAESRGGGISAVDSQVVILQSTVSDNESASHGGGVYSGLSTVTLVDSTVSDNRAAASGGGAYSTFGGPIDVIGSTVSGNSAEINGGGLKANSGSLVNATVSGNVAGATGGAIYAGGYYETFELRNATITGNSAAAIGGLIFVNEDVAPLSGGSSLILGDTIIAGNTGDNCWHLNSNPDTRGGVFDDDSTCASARPITPGTDFLTTLADNGGPTATHAILAQSVAIDAADGDCGLPTDQRGFPRDDGTCDSGAYEFDPFTIAISGKCPGAVTIDITTDEPNQRVAVFVGRGLGTSSLPSGPCAGTELDIDMARLWSTATSDGMGKAQILADASANVCTRVLQAVDGNCGTSSTTEFP